MAWGGFLPHCGLVCSPSKWDCQMHLRHRHHWTSLCLQCSQHSIWHQPGHAFPPPSGQEMQAGWLAGITHSNQLACCSGSRKALAGGKQQGGEVGLLGEKSLDSAPARQRTWRLRHIHRHPHRQTATQPHTHTHTYRHSDRHTHRHPLCTRPCCVRVTGVSKQTPCPWGRGDTLRGGGSQ